MKKITFLPGVNKYEIQGETVYAEYMGRQNGFECCVCGKGCNAYTFNILHGDNYEDAIKNYQRDDYETWGFGADHLEENVKFEAICLR